jgi:hypothetical protein
MLKRLPVLIVVVLSSSCAARQAQVAVQASLTSLATGLVTADEAVAGAMPDAAAEAREQVLRESESVDQGLARYDVLMRPWSDATEALRVTRAALYLAQGGVSAWIDSGDLPASWEPLCADVGASVEALVELLQNLGIELPEVVTLIAGYAEQACTLARPWIAR